MGAGAERLRQVKWCAEDGRRPRLLSRRDGKLRR
jgi:hypothetical protein